MRAWRSPKGILIELGPAAVAITSDLLEDLPEGPWRQPQDFLLIDEHGMPRDAYKPSVWSVDDDLGVVVSAVADGALREVQVVQHHGSVYRVRRTETVQLDGLREIPESDRASWELIRDAVTSDRRLNEHRAEEAQRDGERRVAAIQGAREDFGAGPEFEHAQRLLCERVQNYGEAIDVSLLQTLTLFGRFYRRHRDDALVAAVDRLVLACRRAAFDPTLRQKDPAVQEPDRGIASLPENDRRTLADALEALEKALRAESDGQAEADAPMNSREFDLAADHVARALRCLRR